MKITGVLALCALDRSPTANTLPSISMSITQLLRLSDGSLLPLDMDRGVTSVRHGLEEGEPVSWKRPLAALIREVLDLVADDDPTGHPWSELAEAARTRGVEVDAAELSRVPYEVVLTAEVVEVFVE